MKAYLSRHDTLRAEDHEVRMTSLVILVIWVFE